ncbi:MAG TPA: CoA transferase, partial [Aggregatilineales bacterium]|nr:CoA transferase [Aggregatilineales bacterium]
HMNPVPGGELLSGGYACYRVYRTTDDKPITLAALEPKFWQQFCILAGRDDLAQRDHLMLEDQSDLTAEITALFASKTYAEWMVILDGSETCATPLLDVMQSETDAQIQSRGALFHADGVAHTFTPFRMGERIAYRPAPALGADTDQILQEAGYGIEELASLRERHIIR